MFRNYLTIALRNLVRHKLFSFINIAGLAVGLACVIFIILFVRDETSYDKWVPDSDNVYRLEMSIVIPDRPLFEIAVVPFPMAAAMQAESPMITGHVELNSSPITLTNGDRQFVEQVKEVNPEFFTVIRLPLLRGDPATVLKNPDSIVLSETGAKKYFGDTDPIGKVLTTGRGDCQREDTACLSQTISLKVTGIMRDIPHNSQLNGDAYIPDTGHAARISDDQKTDWFSENGWGYVRLAPGVDPNTVNAAMKAMLDRNVTPSLRKFGIRDIGSHVYAIHLTPFRDVHLKSGRWQFNLMPPGSETTVFGVAAIGALILLVACFNFMNLATARAMMRAREIALRKTLGAHRRQLIMQFLGEAVLIALLSLVLALALVEMLLPLFDSFLQRPITFSYLHDWPLLLLVVAVAVLAGLISGSYPALVLSGFRPASVLRTNSAGQSGSGRLRAALVVVQFAVSIGLGISALVVFSQISFARGVDLGFRHDNVVVMGSGRLNAKQRDDFARVLRTNPGVIDVGLSNMAPFDNGQSLALVQLPGHSDNVTLNGLAISPDYPRTYGIRLLAGRVLEETRSDDALHSLLPEADPLNDGKNVLLNEAGAHRLGFTPQQAIGQTLIMNHAHLKIVGVIADTKIHGALEPVHPFLYAYIPNYPLEFSVRLKPDAVPQTLAFIDRTWRSFSPNAAISRYFLSDTFNKLYADDERQGTMFGIFVAIAIAIACLGLFGLAAFTAARRTREIGIRKVFGARTRDVVLLLLWQFSIPVLIANVIAWPLAWYYLNGWLQTFAYRISLSPLYFIGAGAVAILIAWGTVFAHALRVARANPVYALRHE